YLGQWLASSEKLPGVENALKEVEDLWEVVHELARQLEAPARGGKADGEAALTALDKLRERAERGFTAQLKRFREHVAALDDAARQQNWRDHEAALSVPLLETDPHKRLELLHSVRDISGKLHEETGKRGDDAAKKAEDEKGLREADARHL